MPQNYTNTILKATGATSILREEIIQELWSGYGILKRVWLSGGESDSVIVKHVRLEHSGKPHPRGWNTDIGHKRKVRSYHVETNFYQKYSEKSRVRLPNCLAIEHSDSEILIVLEDLDAAGFPLRKQDLSWQKIEACINWLAQFHATYLGTDPEGLWEIGTYWHLETRPQELAKLTNIELQKAAPKIDEILNSCKYKTLVHGDAKLANFCFGEDGRVAALDFQYVGGGCGMKDLAYFIGSVLSESDCEKLENKILDTYFRYLQHELPKQNTELESEWRSMYHLAWADFHRFLKGWSPGHWKINSYSERITQGVIMDLSE